MLCAPHECPNQQTPQQIFQKLQDHTKKHDLNKIKKTYTVSTPHTNTPTTRAPAHCHNIPFHQYTSSQHNTQLCLKRIEQSTLLSSQTTHHTNNTTTHKHACSTIISRSSHDKSPQPTPPRSQPEMKSSPRRLIQLYTPTPTTATHRVSVLHH